MLSSDKFGNFVAGYTLGRSSDSATFAAATELSDWKNANSHMFVAPIVGSGTSLIQYNDNSYKLTAYKVDDSHTRVAIAYDNAIAHSSTYDPSDYNFFVGFAVDSNIKYFNANNAHSQFNGSDYSSSTGSFYSGGNGSYTKTYPTGVPFSSTYFELSWAQGNAYNNLVHSGTAMTYSFDVYDVKAATGSTVAGVINDKYVFKDKTNKNIVFNSEVSLTFDGIDANESETYKINGSKCFRKLPFFERVIKEI